jgi:hypothetical protein
MSYAVSLHTIGADPDIQPLEVVFAPYCHDGGLRLAKLRALGIYLVGDCEWFQREDVARINGLSHVTLAALDDALAAYGSRWGLRCRRPPIVTTSLEFRAMAKRMGVHRVGGTGSHKARLAEQEQGYRARLAAYPRRLAQWEEKMARRERDAARGLSVPRNVPPRPQLPTPATPAIPEYETPDIARVIEAILVERARERGPLCYIPRERPART